MEIHKSRRALECAACIWIGIGLMSAIDGVRSHFGFSSQYNWIMLGFSIVFVAICAILLTRGKK